MSHHQLNRFSVFIATAALVAGTLNAPAAAAPPSPTIKINDASILEGDSGVKLLTFTVTAKGKGAGQARVDYATQNNTAEAGSDYEGRSGNLSFSNSRQQVVGVEILGDVETESNEQFSVNLTNATGANIRDPQGLGTIQDDDAAQVLPTVSIDDDVVGEGNASSTTQASFEVTLSKPSTSTVTVNYTTANGTATAGSDYTAVPSTTLTFAPGDTTKSAAVDVLGDDTNESADETFAVNLSGASGATIADGSATGTIIDDENNPAVSIGDVTVTEGDTGVTTANLQVTLSHASATDVTVDYATIAGSADAAEDFNAVPSTTLTFLGNGPLSKTVSVDVVGDLLDESDESFTVDLSNIQGGLPADVEGKALIIDNDTSRVRVDGDTAMENNGPVAFTVSLTKAHSQNVTVSYTSANGTAKAASDYVATTASVSFATGTTSRVVSVPLINDDVAERSEQFSFSVTETVNAELADGNARGTILDDDRQRSYTKVSKRIRNGRIYVKGRLSPAHKGRRMTVTLKKRKSGRWVKVRSKRPQLSAGVDVNGDGVLDSKYSTRFLKPKNTRRCQVIARFAGDLHHFPSKARRTFRC